MLIVQLAGIGDSLMSIQTINELKRKNPKSKIDVLVMWKGGKEIIESQNLKINNLYQFNMLKEGILKTIKFCLTLRKNKYDLIVNLAPQARVHYDIVSYLIGAKKIIGFDYGNGKIHSINKKILLDEITDFDYNKHIIKQNLEIIGSNSKKEWKIKIPEKIKKKIHSELKNIKGKKIGIHIGSGTTKNLHLKRWPIENWEKLIKMIIENEKINVLLFGLEETQDNLKIKNLIKSNRIIVMNKSNLIETIAEINKCDLFISADSLLMHIANSLGKKQIIIAGPALDKTIEPIGKNKTILKANLPCQPCYRYGKYLKCTNKEKFACIRLITPEIVFNKVNSLLNLKEVIYK